PFGMPRRLRFTVTAARPAARACSARRRPRQATPRSHRTASVGASEGEPGLSSLTGPGRGRRIDGWARLNLGFGGEDEPPMTMLLSRQFTVDRPLEQAWQHLARAERWPTWAKHIRQVELQPPGEVGPNTTGRLTLSNGVKSALTMTEFNPQRNWKWVGRFLWLTVSFDHRFEELNPMQTKLTWIVEAK